VPDNPEHLSKRLLEEGQKSLSFFRDLPESQRDLMVYSDGSRWSVRQVLAHFVDAENGFTSLIEDVLKGGSGTPEDFNIDMYNERHVARMQDIPFEELLEQFQQYRENNAGIVFRITPEDLDRQGRHPFLGLASLSDMIKLIYRHNQIHLRDIRRLTG
jgi:DinB superfamily